MMIYGSYKNISGGYTAFAKWLATHSIYKMSDAPERQICHRGPWNETNEDNYLTEIQIPVEFT